MSDSSEIARPRKAIRRRVRIAADGKPFPKLPYPDFPLRPHPVGKWCIRIKGKTYYFGTWMHRQDGELVRVEGDGWEEALKLYKAAAEDIHAGRTPRVKGDALTVKMLGDAFLTAKHRKLAAGELGARQFDDYRRTCQLVADTFGKDRRVEDLAADDFERLRAKMAERWGPNPLGNAITRIKSLFKYGIDNGLIEKAIRYGSEFKKPSKAVMRKHKAQNGQRMLEADQLRKLLDAADPQLKAMILLGLNAGFGNTDCATLPIAAIDLDKGWLDFPRPKTGIARRCPLWPETVAAIQAAIAARPEPSQDKWAGLVFINSRRQPFVRETDKSRTDTVSVQFNELLKAQGLHRADGSGFYMLRHIHRTIADAARDPVACDVLMGHADPTMGGHYRERVDDARLLAVSEHVRSWLFSKPAKKPATKKPAKPTRQRKPKDEPAESSGPAPQLKLFAG